MEVEEVIVTVENTMVDGVMRKGQMEEVQVVVIGEVETIKDQKEGEMALLSKEQKCIRMNAISVQITKIKRETVPI